MNGIPHIHDESTDNHQLHAQRRWSGEIVTPNYRLAKTKGTDTSFSLTSRRTLWTIQFNQCRFMRNEVQFYVGEYDEDENLPYLEMDQVGDFWHHELDSVIKDALEHIEEHQMLPQPDTVVDSERFLNDEIEVTDGEE